MTKPFIWSGWTIPEKSKPICHIVMGYNHVTNVWDKWYEDEKGNKIEHMHIHSIDGTCEICGEINIKIRDTYNTCHARPNINTQLDTEASDKN